MNTRTLLIGISVIVALGGVVYFLVLRKNQEGQKRDTNDTPLPPQNDFPGGEINPDPSNIDQVQPQIEQVGVDDRLDWVDNKELAEYLQDLLQPSAYDKLKNWVNTIETERSKDSSAYPPNAGLTGQFSDIGHALYQMGSWNTSVLNKLKEIQG